MFHCGSSCVSLPGFNDIISQLCNSINSVHSNQYPFNFFVTWDSRLNGEWPPASTIHRLLVAFVGACCHCVYVTDKTEEDMKHSKPQHAPPCVKIYTAVIWTKPCNGNLLKYWLCWNIDYAAIPLWLCYRLWILFFKCCRLNYTNPYLTFISCTLYGLLVIRLFAKLIGM